MHGLEKVQTFVYPAVGAAVTTDLVDFGGSTGVVAVFNPVVPFEVIRWGLMVDDNELLDVGDGVVLTLKKYLIPGSATNAVTLGTISSTADVAKGSGLYSDLAVLDTDGTAGPVASSTDYLETGATRWSPPTPVLSNRLVLPGQQLVVDLTDAADTSGKGHVWVTGIPKPFIGLQLDNYTKVAS